METGTNPPVIGISGSSADSASVRAMVTQIRDSGGVPLFLSNHSQRKAEDDLPKIDALVVMGNNDDIDPARYGAQRNSHTQPETLKKDGTPNPEGIARADYEEAMLAAALAKKIPVMGVCGGMQRLNVLLGGSLHQHVPDLTGNDEHAQQDANIPPFIPVQPVLISQGSTLSGIADGQGSLYVPAPGSPPPGVVFENSMHHQAVDRVGSDLRVAATSEDQLPNGQKMVEAIEADPNGKYGQQFVVGVQWHPEFGASPLGHKIAERVVAEGQAFAKANPHDVSLDAIMQDNIKSSLPVIKTGEKTPPVFREGSLAGKIVAEKNAAATQR